MTAQKSENVSFDTTAHTIASRRECSLEHTHTQHIIVRNLAEHARVLMGTDGASDGLVRVLPRANNATAGANRVYSQRDLDCRQHSMQINTGSRTLKALQPPLMRTHMGEKRVYRRLPRVDLEKGKEESGYFVSTRW